MEFKEYNENDYLNYTDINYMGECIYQIYLEIQNKYGYAFPTHYYVASINDILYRESFNSTLTGIQGFKDNYFNFDGFIDLKKCLNWQTINYKEINDMCTDIKIIYDNIDEIGNRNIWDFNYLINWNEDSDIEWEE